MLYIKEDLAKCCLSALRQIGRELGVKSPTSLTKNSLIDEIIKVENGLVNPHFTKVGRKCLNIEYGKQENQDNRKELSLKKSKEKEFLLELDKLTSEYKQRIIKLYNKYALDK